VVAFDSNSHLITVKLAPWCLESTTVTPSEENMWRTGEEGVSDGYVSISKEEVARRFDMVVDDEEEEAEAAVPSDMVTLELVNMMDIRIKP
jgi:hypothetical protein